MDSHIALALAHLLIIAPGLLYVAINRSANPTWVYSALLYVGIFVLLYHGFKAFVRLSKKSPSAWINLIHVLLFAPLLIFIGWNGRDTGRAAYEMLAMIGFAAVGYHLYGLITMLQVNEQSKT